MHVKFTLIILDIMSSLRRRRRVSLSNVVIHQSLGTEQTEAARATQYTAQHVLCGLLEPVAHCILELLVPHHWACNSYGQCSCDAVLNN